MKTIALLGAGGKMGVRLATNLQGSPYEVLHVEPSVVGRERLKAATGFDCVDGDNALAESDAVLLAVPDRLIGKIAHTFIEKVKPGTAIIMLDAAAPHAGELPERDDVSYFVTHPCHPPIFNDEVTEQGKKDFFGGVHAKQHIVCALMQGPEEHYAACEAIARTIYKPVMRAHRCTVEQIAIMEPALAETIGATLCLALRAATDEAVRRGVPRQAATDFMLGHLTIELAIAFEIFPEGKFSDGALYAIEQARPEIFREGWLERIFDPDAIKRSVAEICNPPKAA
ncbi:phosphogluconate dehydrogenase C-terminal domain-containing protein [Bosea sp. PAMC 26642]|uniref:phosphogluconate dehydrogenase C-terminal domain-containing protein n=1 Tax=Bosea sp. (strain PAMC 26642) TaxID=1792307 RepID=UPI00076FF8E4|nr:phosphogluconate dehydrogenase C-terminal domain-containing protein [Bosea sp. PAMC 26642]AMJ61678.1 semialdehyde dehydrogenase [Bosea sp. PAMC 26642]